MIVLRLRLRMFLHYDRVSPRRNRGSGEGANYLPRTYLPWVSGTRLGHPDDLEWFTRDDLSGSDCIAVHSARIEWRLVVLCNERLEQNTAGRITDSDSFRRRRRNAIFYEGEGILYRKKAHARV
jgi:hypothetical protein